MLKQILESTVDPTWENPGEAIRRTYDLMSPHCDQAKPYRQVDGKTRWKCTHPIKEAK